MRAPLEVVLLDTVTAVGPAHTGAVVITGSHGGASVVRYARAVAARLYVFNDAGVGKDGAGIAALAELERDGIAAATVSHDSARIGEAADAYASGVVSRVNRPAAALLVVGRALRPQLEALSAVLASTAIASRGKASGTTPPAGKAAATVSSATPDAAGSSPGDAAQNSTGDSTRNSTGAPAGKPGDN
jgi:hypothetical protein